MCSVRPGGSLVEQGAQEQAARCHVARHSRIRDRRLSSRAVLRWYSRKIPERSQGLHPTCRSKDVSCDVGTCVVFAQLRHFDTGDVLELFQSSRDGNVVVCVCRVRWSARSNNGQSGDRRLSQETAADCQEIVRGNYLIY